jgi:DedD protein
MAEAVDVNTLKRRSRRRLVGAVALVLLAVIVLPMVFDTEPRQIEPTVSVRIPPEDEEKFEPKLSAPPEAVPAPRPAAKAPSSHEKSEPAVAAPVRPATPTPPKAEAPAKHAEAKPAARRESSEHARAEAALRGVEYVVPVIALANLDKVKEQTARLAAAKLPYYTEPVATAQGSVTRIRAGPFGDRAAAEMAAQKLRGMGFNPGKVFEKP